MGARIFTILYAAAMCVVAVVLARHDWRISNLTHLWLFGVGPAVSYIVLAIAHLRRGGITSTYKNLLVILALAQFTFWEPEVLEVRNHPEMSLVAFLLLVGVAWGMVTRSEQAAGWARRLQTIIQRVGNPQLLMIAGAALVFATLFLPMAFGAGDMDLRAAGWRVLARQARWITSEIGLPAAPFGNSMPRLSPVFGVIGCAFYVVTLAGSLASVALLAGLRLSSERLRGSAVARRLGAAALLAAAWAVTDLFWGWHFELDAVPWAVVFGVGCWAAALGYAAAIAGRIARGHLGGLSGFVLFQLPLVAFNCAVLPVYWTSDINMSGLGLLFLGAQAQAWGYASLLMGERQAGAGRAESAR